MLEESICHHNYTIITDGNVFCTQYLGEDIQGEMTEKLTPEPDLIGTKKGRAY